MKKTAYLAILCFIALPAFSQKEAMQTGTPPPRELTINGKPYSQYKAEQDALKQQQAAKQQAALVSRPKGLTITANTETADPALQRMNEPVQYGVKVMDDKVAPDPGKTEDAALVKTEVKQPAATPEVPVHFRLPENRTWGNTAAAEIPVKDIGVASQIKSDPAQPVNAPVRGEAYKTPVMKDANISGDKKDMNPADAKTITPASIVSNKKAETAKPAPEVPEQFRLPATQSWNGRPVTVEAAHSLSTEKAASRTAADVPKTIEPAADKVQKPAAEKITAPALPGTGAGTGETSKVSVPEMKYPQQEAPKKN